MSNTSSNSPDSGMRKKMRKGTHSCLECRRRKIRCVFRPDRPSVCLECFARGTRCREQKIGDLEQPSTTTSVDSRTNLRERVARLENLIENILDRETPTTSRSVGESERGAAEALSSLRSDALPPTPMSSLASDSPSTYPPEQHGNAPLLSLFDNAVLRRNSDIHSEDAYQSPASLSGNDRHSSKNSQVREVLLSKLPSANDLEAVLLLTGRWWSSWRRLFPEIDAPPHQSLAQFVSWGFQQESPVTVALALQCLAISIKLIRPGIDDRMLNLPLPPKELMEYYLGLVERHLISDNDYASSLEGIEVVVMQGKAYVDMGQPRKAWLLFRQAISYCQLQGLHRHRPGIGTKTRMSLERRESAWRSLYQLDRYMSLLLGLPYAIADDHYDLGSSDPDVNPTEIYQRKLSVIAGQVIDRNQAGSTPSLAVTMEIERRLDALAKSMPSQWWDVASAQASGTIDMEEFYTRFMAQFWHQQIRAFLHLPFMLQSIADQQFEYNRVACFEASRELIQKYHALRMDDGSAFNMCRVIDQGGLTAAVLLLLGLLGYGKMSSAHNPEQEELDWKLVEITKNVFRRASAEQGGEHAFQALQLLDTLSAARQQEHSPEGSTKPKFAGKMIVPYFGTITIAPGSKFSAEKTASVMDRPQPSAGGPMAAPLSNPSAMPTMPPDIPLPGGALAMPETYQPSLAFDGFDPTQTSPFGFPQVEGDWQSMMDMDIDQDWNWYLSGGQVS
ncbi:hypothetical protein MMC09_006738 [Bachmanniomyces sp. S44760]|nr:hypothetical protein [Bachmanniomyces sp. S44760]